MWLGSRIGFRAETGTHVTIISLFPVFFSPFYFFFGLVFPLVSFPLPAVLKPVFFLSFMLLRARSSYPSFSSMYQVCFLSKQ